MFMTILVITLFAFAALAGLALLARTVNRALPAIQALKAAQRGEAPVKHYQVTIREVSRRRAEEPILYLPVFASRARARRALTRRLDRPQQRAAAA